PAGWMRDRHDLEVAPQAGHEVLDAVEYLAHPGLLHGAPVASGFLLGREGGDDRHRVVARRRHAGLDLRWRGDVEPGASQLLRGEVEPALEALGLAARAHPEVQEHER